MHVFTHNLMLFAIFFREASCSCGWQLIQRFISNPSVENKSDDGWQDIYIILSRLMEHPRKGDEDDARARGWGSVWHKKMSLGHDMVIALMMGLPAQNLHKIRSLSASSEMERGSGGTISLTDLWQWHPHSCKQLWLKSEGHRYNKREKLEQTFFSRRVAAGNGGRNERAMGVKTTKIHNTYDWMGQRINVKTYVKDVLPRK